jgi:acyl-CoA thioester hydrolase
MGTFYNSRALEWFECGRTEHMRQLGVAYTEMEDRGVLLPLIEAHVRFLGRARYDDPLTIVTTAAMSGRARIRFENRIYHAETDTPISDGYTIHAIIDPAGKPVRPPSWFVELFGSQSGL